LVFDFITLANSVNNYNDIIPKISVDLFAWRGAGKTSGVQATKTAGAFVPRP
jgi:hypothetical protein